MRIREGRVEDLPRLLDIYDHYVDHTHITFDTERISLEARRSCRVKILRAGDVGGDVIARR